MKIFNVSWVIFYQFYVLQRNLSYSSIIIERIKKLKFNEWNEWCMRKEECLLIYRINSSDSLVFFLSRYSDRKAIQITIFLFIHLMCDWYGGMEWLTGFLFYFIYQNWWKEKQQNSAPLNILNLCDRNAVRRRRRIQSIVDVVVVIKKA